MPDNITNPEQFIIDNPEQFIINNLDQLIIDVQHILHGSIFASQENVPLTLIEAGIIREALQIISGELNSGEELPLNGEYANNDDQL
ncbi:MAG: hypothetical protein NWP61_04890 [Rickettsiaceae bacterium]|nr:hypothetical protein [Rickettsiaceae bacterium]